MPVQLLLLLACAALGSPGPAQAAPARWQSPLPGFTVARGFAFDRREPFAAGRRRVADLAGRPGQAVRSPCAGRVRFAGALPSGSGVSVSCGALVATLTGLGAASVDRGETVSPGQPVGRAPGSGMVRLGARVAGDRHGYLDPLGLLSAAPRTPLLAPAPRPGRPLRAHRRPAARAQGPSPSAAVLLGAAWLGLGLAGSAIGAGIALRGPRRAATPAARARPAGR